MCLAGFTAISVIAIRCWLFDGVLLIIRFISCGAPRGLLFLLSTTHLSEVDVNQSLSAGPGGGGS